VTISQTTEAVFPRGDFEILQQSIMHVQYSETFRSNTAIYKKSNVHITVHYRIAGNFRGRKLSRIDEKEDFAEKTFVDLCSCMGVTID
jgi:hypothetical protein